MVVNVLMKPTETVTRIIHPRANCEMSVKPEAQSGLAHAESILNLNTIHHDCLTPWPKYPFIFAITFFFRLLVCLPGLNDTFKSTFSETTCIIPSDEHVCIHVQ